MQEPRESGRRQFIKAAAVAIVGLLLAGCALKGGSMLERGEASGEAHVEEGISPAEDLMREHGVLKRILLIYGEASRRINAGEELPAEPIADAAGIIRSFIEDYHEKLEEDYLFPRFRKANKLVDLVDVLLEQHRAGRRLTDAITKLSTAQAMKNADERRALAVSLRTFIRMYGPHAAREDTVLFAAIRDIVSAEEYHDLGEEFEEKEHALFGEGGFGNIVDRVAVIEKALGIHDLRQFTPVE